MGEENKTRDAVDAVTGLVKTVPVYEDVVQPAAKEIGTALQTVAKTVHIALAPISGLVWGYDQVKEFVATSVAKRLDKTPKEKIITPMPQIAGPALEALRYAGHEESLREMYAKLLATAMDADKAKIAHPGFVEVIRQLTADEAKICHFLKGDIYFPLISIQTIFDGGVRDHVKHFSLIGNDAGCIIPNLTQQYLGNLCRLGLAEILSGTHMTDETVYERLNTYPPIAEELERLKKGKKKFEVIKEVLSVTNFGLRFFEACTDSDISAADSKKLPKDESHP
jgi:hypothetical protein